MAPDTQKTRPTSTLRTVLGIIMIIIYVGMGVLFLCNFFPWLSGSWAWLRWVGGILFIVYGLWRAYRQFSGIDTSV
ncbi:MAG: hypothetical protein NC187_01090 [Candidatus Amulumruptor caecigallinarius]|nr:hypothetical protein [Candidatus Amulumruptor caecigallinarius]MCM1396071.1 hypothetical protein [Candidatus Amulumruptor caecigallinarius]MCM1453920.1 hypothetical protein [bacterium]